ncbi:MAG: (2Fe-2S) ferredoxin domain-containing protein [Trueperaceae bacterium]
MSPLAVSQPFPLETAPSRRKLVQVTICNGSSCGKTEKGFPPIPIDWLKAQWKEKKLLKTVQLTIGGCFGACDLTNVACVQHACETVHLGNLSTQDHYDELLGWAERVTEHDRLEPLPVCLQERRFELFREALESESFPQKAPETLHVEATQ